MRSSWSLLCSCPLLCCCCLQVKCLIRVVSAGLVAHAACGPAQRLKQRHCSTNGFRMIHPFCTTLLLRPLQSVYHVCWMRGLFPEASFSGHDLSQLDREWPQAAASHAKPQPTPHMQTTCNL